jgi:N6-adenosine-specific RNA methylase IME4
MSAGPDEFDVILADPPWRYAWSLSSSRAIEQHYPTMTVEDLCALSVPAAQTSVLFLWATPPLLPEALTVMRAWGFDYRSNLVWDKQHIGMGFWFRQQHEHLLVGRRGEFPAPPPSARVPSVLSEVKRQHSRKPDTVRHWLASWYSGYRLLEMFARTPAPGWASWGNQATDLSVASLEAERWDPQAARNPNQGTLFCS